MTGSTKILTVSYGTFSCTLEGFDDPLESMRDIAEYFRDLAADDRYFGAEPPTPDVEMLQNLAERQVQQQVEARRTDAGVSLVASQQADQQPAAAAPVLVQAKASAPAENAAGPLAFDDEYLMSDEPEDILAVSPSPVADADRPAESVAEKLRRIRAVVSQSIEDSENLGTAAAEADAVTEDTRDRAQTQTIQDIASDLADDEEAVRPVTVQPQAPDAGRVLSDVVNSMSEASNAEKSTDTSTDDVDEQSYEEDDDDTDEGFDQAVSGVLQKLNSTEAEQPAQEERPTSQRAVTKVLAPKPDADVGRLLDETDTKLNDDETVRRRRVISQMRAAVAATKADRSVTPVVSREAKEEAEKTPYRGDLSEVVKGPTKSEDAATPPLMLVSSQRVHDPDDAKAEQVEPPQAQEVAPVTTKPDENSSFADFVSSVGAKELDELLEAAAAYTVFAEGQPTFTRPEIMKRVAHADPGLELTREDSLRSFGQLLRKGKFKKLERGQFTIDEDTRFHPSQQIAGE